MNLGMFACNFRTNFNGMHHQTHDLLLTRYSRLLGHRAIGPGPLIGKIRMVLAFPLRQLNQFNIKRDSLLCK